MTASHRALMHSLLSWPPAGMDTVFHCASAAVTTSNSANKALMSSVNITGTHNVIEGCVWGGVHRLIYTSTSSVVFQGRDLNNVDETAPYAARPMDYYTQTKVLTMSITS